MTLQRPGLKKGLRILLWVLTDALLVNGALFMAQVLRYSDNISYQFFYNSFRLAPVMTALFLFVFWACGLYRTMWQYASARDLVRLSVSTLAATVLTYAFSLAANAFVRPHNLFLLHRLVYLLLWILSTCLVACSRLLYRTISTRARMARTWHANARRVMVIGAGWAGANVVHEMQRGSYGHCVPVLVVDDDAARNGTRISGVPVLRGTGNILKLASDFQVDDIIIAIATPWGDLKTLIEKCMATGCRVRRVHPPQEIRPGPGQRHQVRDININDLLGRPEEQLDMSCAGDFFRGKTVLITGGGGSIGSELCRRLLPLSPERVVLLDISENYMYDLFNDLCRSYGDPHGETLRSRLILCVGSVQDQERLEEVFGRYQPQVVLHAAAHKHVPLMEDCPEQAVKNNVLGTYRTALAAMRHGAERFVLISTDKAVNPTNVMGATKRLAEIVVEGLNAQGSTAFTAVRFGNVLGSHGSVVPLFERQIRSGGPVTLTHPDIIRYFMTIPEAASLVLQAASIAKGGERFVLDMGKPVRIKELAERMIQLYAPDGAKVDIVYIGLRPGEKLYEELLLSGEGMRKTQREKIFVTEPETVAPEDVQRLVGEVESCLAKHEDMVACLRRLVPEFRSAEEVNQAVSNSQDAMERAQSCTSA